MATRMWGRIATASGDKDAKSLKQADYTTALGKLPARGKKGGKGGGGGAI